LTKLNTDSPPIKSQGYNAYMGALFHRSSQLGEITLNFFAYDACW